MLCLLFATVCLADLSPLEVLSSSIAAEESPKALQSNTNIWAWPPSIYTRRAALLPACVQSKVCVLLARHTSSVDIHYRNKWQSNACLNPLALSCTSLKWLEYDQQVPADKFSFTDHR